MTATGSDQSECREREKAQEEARKSRGPGQRSVLCRGLVNEVWESGEGVACSLWLAGARPCVTPPPSSA